MQVGISAQVTGADGAAFVAEAERLGAASVWVPEVWGQDALTPLAYVAGRTRTIKLGSAIAALGARTPAMLAMSAMSLQMLSGGRFLLGWGTSGPQVMEGWHGVRFRSPVAATRETIEIVRAVARGDRLSYAGRVFRLPLPDGPGRALRSMLPPTEVPILVAALGPRNLELTGELADGWIGNAFVPEQAPVFLDHLRSRAAPGGRPPGPGPATPGGGERRPRGGRPGRRPRRAGGPPPPRGAWGVAPGRRRRYGSWFQGPSTISSVLPSGSRKANMAGTPGQRSTSGSASTPRASRWACWAAASAVARRMPGSCPGGWLALRAPHAVVVLAPRRATP